MLDVVTLGEAMIRLATPVGEALESASSLELRVAGSEANVAIILARMGFRAGWISKLPDDPLGRRIAAEVRRHGVDISRVVWVSQGRTGLYFIERVPTPQSVTVYYDRAGSACAALTPEEVDWAYVRSARWVHVTGITSALSPSCAAVVVRMLEEARSSGIPTSLDINYRRKLWSPERARETLEPLFGMVHILIVAQEDAREMLCLDGDAAEIASRLWAQWRLKAAIVTAGPQGAYLSDHNGMHHEPALQAVEVDPIGRGDAFAAGVLWGALEGDVRVGLRYGVALAAIAQATRGDIPWCTRQDVLQILTGGKSRPRR
jgi:2-dehydro-3-deoxygluconokinase